MDAAKDLDYMAKFDETLKSSFKFYLNSPRRLRGLEHGAESLGLGEQLKKITKLKNLRWVASE